MSQATTEERQVELEIEQVRHVVTDREGMHLVAHEDANYALCGSGAGGLRKFGDAPESLEDAAQFGAWVNVRDDMCDECAETFNKAVFDR